jgi:hypothetical protein
MRYYKFILLMFITISLSGNDLTMISNNTNSYHFIENRGQIVDQHNRRNSAVKYLVSMPHMNVQLREAGFSYDIFTIKEQESSPLNPYNLNQEHPDTNKRYIHINRIDVQFMGCNRNVEIIAQDEIQTKFNYYSLYVKDKEVTNVKAYQKIVYKNLYPQIDLEFIIDKERVKFNFILNPGADINQIRWKYEGGEAQLKESRIEIGLKNNLLTEDIPESYMENGNNRAKIIIDYRSLGNNIFGFSTKEDLSIMNKIIIDPVPDVLWGTYYGGALKTCGLDVCTDSRDHIYMAGYTSSVDNIASSGVFEDSLLVLEGGYIVKFNKEGQRLYATYYSAIRQITDINCDKNDNVIVGGMEELDSMATVGAYQEYSNLGDAVIVKFDSIGNRIWATYYGSVGIETYIRTCLDSNDNIYVAGQVQFLYQYDTNNVLGTPGTFHPTYNNASNDSRHGFVAKFTPSGNRIWGTYITAPRRVRVDVIATDKWNNILVAGSTHSADSIGTAGTFQPSPPYIWTYFGGYLLKLDSTGKRTWGTYYTSNVFGESYSTTPTSLITDKNGNIFMAGHTETHNTGNNLASTGAHQTYNAGNYDGYLVKFNPNGTRAWGTFYGGSSGDALNSISVDLNGNPYIFGGTQSSTNIVTSNGFKTNIDSVDGDAYLVKFNSNGQRVWGSYYGGFGSEPIYGSHIDSYGKIIITGGTNCSQSIATQGSFQATKYTSGTVLTAYVLKLSDCNSPSIPIITSNNTSICPGQAVTLNIAGQLGGATHWGVYSNGNYLGNATNNAFTVVPYNTTQYEVRGIGGCVIKSDPGQIIIGTKPAPIVDAGKDTALCDGVIYLLNATGNASTYQWNNGMINNSLVSFTSPIQLIVTATGANGCANKDTLNVQVNPLPNVNYNNGFHKICLSDAPRPVYGGLPAGGYYSGNGIYGGIFYPDSTGVGQQIINYYYTNNFGCIGTDTSLIFVDPCVGLEDIIGSNKLKISVYPNPANSIIFFEIEGKNTDYQLIIYNAQGQEINQQKIQSGINKLNLASYAMGNYYYRIIERNNEIRNGGFVIN